MRPDSGCGSGGVAFGVGTLASTSRGRIGRSTSSALPPREVRAIPVHEEGREIGEVGWAQPCGLS